MVAKTHEKGTAEMTKGIMRESQRLSVSTATNRDIRRSTVPRERSYHGNINNKEADNTIMTTISRKTIDIMPKSRTDIINSVPQLLTTRISRRYLISRIPMEK